LKKAGFEKKWSKRKQKIYRKLQIHRSYCNAGYETVFECVNVTEMSWGGVYMRNFVIAFMNLRFPKQQGIVAV
jgi:hypothetical protein